MLIKWKKDNVNVVPVLGPGGIIASKITLLPGVNDVDDNDWGKARVSVKDDIDRGLIEEVAANINETSSEVKDEKTGQSKTVKHVEIKSKNFKSMSTTDAVKLVKDTYNLKTLKGWEKDESRDSVRAEIKNQIDAIENHGEDRKKKLKREGDKEGK